MVGTQIHVHHLITYYEKMLQDAEDIIQICYGIFNSANNSKMCANEKGNVNGNADKSRK